MTTIPADLFVSTDSSVIGAGGANLVLNGLCLTNNTRVPIGTVKSFSSVQDVSDFFGASDSMVTGATVYFAGFDTSTAKPGTLLVTQYPTSAVSAYLRGGNISSTALATVQAINAALTIIVDGDTYTNTVNLSSATSFSNAASLIQTALNTSPPTAASFTGAISTTTLTTSAVTGTIIPGQTVHGSGVTAATVIVAQLTGTPGGAGTYSVNNSQSVGSESMTTTANLAVTYDSVSGAFVITSGTTGAFSTIAFATGSPATTLLLTSATAAVLSQGAAVGTPSAFMNAVINITQNWATFFTTFDPDISGNANKQLFAAWVNGTNGRYVYACFDTDATPAATVPATSSLGYLLQQNDSSGTVLLWEVGDTLIQWMFAGWVASIDFEATGGRASFAYKSQSGITPSVSTSSAFVNLAGNPQVQGSFGNGYNCYAAIATANQGFQDFQRGTISGPFKWADSYVNQIWLTNAMQLSLMELMAEANSIPFTQAGAGMIATALSPDIQQGLLFGAYSAGVTLSGSQIAAVNADAGQNISSILSTQGWYLLIRPASATVRANRGPWAVTFYYCDGGSVQSIALSTIALQ